MIGYVHPLLAVLVLTLLAQVASLGVRARNDRRHRRQYLRSHARLAPWVYAGVVLMWMAGVGATWLIRPPDELAASGHFLIGTALVAVLTLAALSSRWMDRKAVRAVHPWLGALALLLSAAQVFFGLPLLP